MKILGFDIESAREPDWSWEESPGVTCIGVCEINDGEHAVHSLHSNYASEMTQADIHQFIEFLVEKQADGYVITAWNSAGFDFRVLAMESDAEHRQMIKALVMQHVDPGFAMVCIRGYMIGLQAAADGLKVVGKLENMTGLEAIGAWQESRERQDLVLRYVEQDARATADVLLATVVQGGIPWTSQKGRPNFFGLRNALRATVERALKVPEPDTSWMSNPRPREEYIGWLNDE